jgi:hypothetical protein
MKIKIPRSIYIFIWCVLGVLILGYSLLIDLIEENEIKINFKMMFGQTFWLVVFVWYLVFFLKSKRNN